MASVGFRRNGVELKAERRKPSGEKHCDSENLPSLTGVLAHFRLHQFNAIGLYAGGAKIRSYRYEYRFAEHERNAIRCEALTLSSSYFHLNRLRNGICLDCISIL